MAIEPIKKVTLVSSRGTGRHLLRTISRLGTVEIIDAGERFQDEEGRLRHEQAPTEEPDERLHKIDLILALLNVFAPEEQSFVASMVPVPQVVDSWEINHAVNSYALDERFHTASELDETYRRSERAKSEIENQLSELIPLTGLSFTLSDFHRPARVCLVFGHLPQKGFDQLDTSAEPWKDCEWEKIELAPLWSDEIALRSGKSSGMKSGEDKVPVIFAFLKEDCESMRKALTDIGFDEIQLPMLPEKVLDHVMELQGDLAEVEARIAEVSKKVRAMAPERRTLITLKAFWTANRNQILAAAKALNGRWVNILTGYIRSRDADRLAASVRKEFPEAIMMFEDPGPDEEVPVSISQPHILRPLSLLVEMFGLPYYRSFDPTPFLTFNFYIFFGICFSDVGYGIMLVFFASYLVKRTRLYGGVNDFARILLYSGFSTMIFGALLGSWFGDLYLPRYLGEGNILLWLQQKFALLDPIEKTIPALLLALTIGVMNQFYGICLKMYGAFRQGDWKGAVFDGLLWLILLPGLLVLVSRLFVRTPPGLFRIGLFLFMAGAIGLILTQGRDLKNPVARILGGVASLYGIIGSYGITAFIGDTLSYCRLLALGLTTSIVGMTFNMLGGLLRDVPYVGFFLFVAIVVVGHVFNFAISILGAFVHSMRLIYVEFFGRFYEAGARPFQPLGFDSPLCIIRKVRESDE
ncbi:MAG: V-type ATP synthase subunit I [Syntrophorhabdus sp. PtaU1.Bin002]|nr:MAG: V-type ATP synthase subunit I [Syntrophorhabdus sp. PtaU1.Bin002]